MRNVYLFTGREYDWETGLQLNRHRYYSSLLGRWLTRDPIGFKAGDSNLYAYVNNAPTGSMDPNGLLAERALQGKFSIYISADNFRPDALNSNVEVTYNVSVGDRIKYSEIELRIFAKTIGRNFLWGGFTGALNGQEQWHRDDPVSGQLVGKWPAASSGPYWTDNPGMTLYRIVNISLLQTWIGEAWGLSKCDGQWYLIKKATWGHSADLAGRYYRVRRWPKSK